jgi:hypothetical protein
MRDSRYEERKEAMSPKTRYLTLQVTQEDIDGAREDRDTESLSESCPLARCLTRAVGQPIAVWPEGALSAAVAKPVAAWWWQRVALPSECFAFMRAFDRLEDPKPMTFSVELPEEWFR